MIIKDIKCKECGESIVDKHDLVTATIFFEAYPFHSYCYVDHLKGAKTIYLGKYPLNGFANNFKVTIISIIAISLLIFADPELKSGALIAVPFLLYRLYSYFAFERHLK